MMNQTALIVGASGLVGSYCVNNLLHAVAYNKVISLTRTPFLHMSQKLNNVQVLFDQLETYRDQMAADALWQASGGPEFTGHARINPISWENAFKGGINASPGFLSALQAMLRNRQ